MQVSFRKKLVEIAFRGWYNILTDPATLPSLKAYQRVWDGKLSGDRIVLLKPWGMVRNLWEWVLVVPVRKGADGTAWCKSMPA